MTFKFYVYSNHERVLLRVYTKDINELLHYKLSTFCAARISCRHFKHDHRCTRFYKHLKLVLENLVHVHVRLRPAPSLINDEGKFRVVLARHDFVRSEHDSVGQFRPHRHSIYEDHQNMLKLSLASAESQNRVYSVGLDKCSRLPR